MQEFWRHHTELSLELRPVFPDLPNDPPVPAREQADSPGPGRSRHDTSDGRKEGVTVVERKRRPDQNEREIDHRHGQAPPA